MTSGGSWHTHGVVYADSMSEKLLTPEEEAKLKAQMEKAHTELETQALIQQYEKATNPLVPAEEPVSEEEGVPTHEIPAEHEVPPDQVIKQEKLGTK